MPKRSPLPIIGAAILLVLVLVVGGTAVGVGPLAATQAPADVTDPKEMIARSLQATIDATAVHLEGTLVGLDSRRPRRTAGGGRVASTAPRSTADIRPKDAKTSAQSSARGSRSTSTR